MTHLQPTFQTNVPPKICIISIGLSCRTLLIIPYAPSMEFEPSIPIEIKVKLSIPVEIEIKPSIPVEIEIEHWIRTP